MSIELRIPKLGMAAEEGTIVEWLVADGASVEVGTLVYAVETEKSVLEVESPAAGTLRIVAQPGEALPIGALVGHID